MCHNRKGPMAKICFGNLGIKKKHKKSKKKKLASLLQDFPKPPSIYILKDLFTICV